MMKKILIGIGVITVACCALWAAATWKTITANARTAKFNEVIETLFTSLQNYKENIGSYPVGGNAQIAKALQGENPKKIIVLVGRKTELNEKGEYLDPWGTPLRFYFSDGGVLIRSAGPNRRFDDSTVLEADDFIRSN
jgi:hypothetical protein